MKVTECQPFMGLLADRLFDPKRKKVPVFPDQVHWWIGRVVMVLAVVTIFLGINQFIPNVYVAFILYGGTKTIILKKTHYPNLMTIR
jgi:hypothetical protein